MALLLQTELLDERRVLALIVLLEVAQMRAAVGDHLEEAATRVEILGILLEVLRKLVDLAGKKTHLYRIRSGIAVMHSHALDRGRLYSFR